jgi:putative oxidoreductase
MHKLMHHPIMAMLRKPMMADIGLLLARVAAGMAFMYHGYPKLFGGPMTAMFFGKIGLPAPALLAPFVGFFEFFGGLLLILGLGMRFWALGHAVIMTVAILAAKGLETWKGIELEVVLLANALNLVLHGAGHYSVDAMLMERSKKEHDAALPVKPV